MSKCLLALLVLAPIASAASIRGVVVEAATGSPLARSRVEVTPVPGTPGKPVAVRVDRGGSFDIFNLAPGLYTVTASREGFLTAEYGQKRWNSAGAPVPIDDQRPAFLDFRLQRYGAVTGAVVDEQDVGILDHEVVVYRANDPQRPVGEAHTDDRGVYRVGGLEPGAYLVRTKAKQIEEIGYLPTFGRETMLASEADRVTADLDRTADTTHIRPAQGRLLQVAGSVVGTYGPFKVTFVTEMGRQTQDVEGSFHFEPVPPGRYEIYATGPGDLRTYTEGAYMLLELKDDQPIVLKMLPMHDTAIRVVDQRGISFRGGTIAPAAANPGRGAAAQTLPTVSVQARRVDLAGVGAPETFKIRGNGTARIAPGRWELRCLAPAGYFVSDYTGTRQKFGARGRPDGWQEITVEGYSSATFTLSPNPASIRGVVRLSGDPAAAAPIFLEPYDSAKHERLWETTTVRSDNNGQYRFPNLAPGTYRILSTFEFRAPTAEDFDAAAARLINVEEGREMLLDLDLWGIR